MKRIIYFYHKLGQNKKGVDKTPMYLKSYINPQYNSVNVRCTNNLFSNLNNLYQVNKNIEGPKVNIGGDHSMSLATVADSLNRSKNLKLIWIDAHADINTYKSSLSKNYHGMPLSFLTGLDSDPKLSFIEKTIPFENILYIGIRDLDNFEVDIIKDNNIKYITVEDIRIDYDECIKKIDTFINKNDIHISFDVDVMDPSIIPSTGTKVPNGLSINEARMLLEHLNKNNIINMDITELNMQIGDVQQRLLSLSNFFKIFKNLSS